MIQKSDPADVYLLKVNNRNTRARCEICLKSTIKNQNDTTGHVINFEHVIAGWGKLVSLE